MPVPNPTDQSSPAQPAAAAGAAPRGLGLRAKLNLVLGTLALLCVAALLWREVDSVRRSVREEIVAANRVATQLLQRVSFIYQRSGTLGMVDFLQQLGRVRANDIALVDDSGQVLYRSPQATYKAGREAPQWFTRWVVPPLQRQEIGLPDGRLTIEADPSRAILDGWDELRALAAGAAVAVLLLLALVFSLVGMTLKPISAILAALRQLQNGDWSARLPALPGREVATLGAAVNAMAAAVQGHVAAQVQAQVRALDAERRLDESRELAHRIEEHMEAERRAIARELHDELGQSVTAIRSLALSLTERLAPDDADGRRASRLIADEAARLYDAMHGMIPRLSPLALDSLGLADTVADLVDGVRQRHPEVEIVVHNRLGGLALPAPAALAAYRVVQEAINNALRHSGASRIDVELQAHADRLDVGVRDNGSGLPDDWQRPGHYGLLGLRERVAALGGELAVGPAERPAPAEPAAAGRSGTRVTARLPLATEPATEPATERLPAPQGAR